VSHKAAYTKWSHQKVKVILQGQKIKYRILAVTFDPEGIYTFYYACVFLKAAYFEHVCQGQGHCSRSKVKYLYYDNSSLHCLEL